MYGSVREVPVRSTKAHDVGPAARLVLPTSRAHEYVDEVPVMSTGGADEDGYEFVGGEPHGEAPGGPTIPPSRRGWYQQSDDECYEYDYSVMAPIEPPPFKHAGTCQ